MTDIVWKTTAFPDATVGVPYEASLAVSNQLSVITSTTVSLGTLPTGLSVHADGLRIVGTPTKAGSCTFKLTANDTAGGVQSGSYAIRVGNTFNEDDRRTMNIPVAAQYAKAWPLG
jgi:hypothetical protein